MSASTPIHPVARNTHLGIGQAGVLLGVDVGQISLSFISVF